MCMGSSARNAELCTMQAEIKDKAWMEHQFTLHQMLKPKAKESKGSEFTMHQVNPHTVWGLTCSTINQKRNPQQVDSSDLKGTLYR